MSQTSEVSLFQLSKGEFSRQKVRKILGKSVPLDVSVREIKECGLKSLLQSNVPLCYFLYTMLEDYSSENLFFYLDVEKFQTRHFENSEDMREKAQIIYDKFIAENSEFEVNIDHRVSAPIQGAIDHFDQDCFREAKDDLERLMEPVFLKFKTGPYFKRMEEELGLYNIVYTRKQRNMAVKLLLTNMDKTLPTGDNTPAGILKNQRNDEVRQMMHRFCKKKLRIDFED